MPEEKPVTTVTMTTVNTRSGQVRKAQEAFARGGDTRYLKRELSRGNPYVMALLKRRGLTYQDGTIRRLDAERAPHGARS